MDGHVDALEEEKEEEGEEEAKEGNEAEQVSTVLCGLDVVAATAADIEASSLLAPSSGAEVYAAGEY